MQVNNEAQRALETARQAAEAAKVKKENAKTMAENGKAKSQEADTAVNNANDKVASQQNIYTQANTRVSSKQAEYETALARLNSVSGGKDEAAIRTAQAEVDRIKAELDRVKDEAQKEYNELVKAQQDAQSAMKRAEIEKKNAEELQKELEAAENDLVKAEDELKEAEEAAKAEELELTKDVSQLTEEEAIAQGYKVIKTADDLKAIAGDLTGKYIIMNDIDLEGVDWEPIGKLNPESDNPWETAFSGVLNGNGFSIKNLSIKNDGSADYVGLFGVTDGAQIENLILENLDINVSKDYNETLTGGLIGLSRDTILDNITASGKVSGHQSVGGLIGRIQDSQGFGRNTISNINTNMEVDASFYAGGIIGSIADTAQNSLVIENCHTSGNINITDMSAGGIIGEAGKTVLTVNNCSSSVNISKDNEEDTGLSWLLDNVSKIGGIVGNCDGTFISICNSNFSGTLNCEDEFKGENYGWYMNDAHVSIFQLDKGLPVDDILNIEGVDAITPKYDPATGIASYDITVSTLAGMNRIVDMIQANPKLGEMITFDVQFDFETMDDNYDPSLYSQYGVVQTIYEDEEGVHNDVYIDNEIDLETTFNVGLTEATFDIEFDLGPKETMVKGLYKADGKYYVYTLGAGNDKYENFTEVSLEFFFENQHTLVTKRLESDEVNLRNRLTMRAYNYQMRIQDLLKEKYGIDKDAPLPTIKEPEYKALKKKQAQGLELTPEEQLKLAGFELNYTIMNIVSEITKNEGCGMGGDASFLEKDKGIPLEDEWGRTRWMTDDGFELRQKVDENGELMVGADGLPVFETLEGEDYDGSHGSASKVRGYAVTDEDGNMLYSDKEGKTVVRTDAEDGTSTYTYEDGTAYEGETEDLKQQLEERSPKQAVDELDKQLSELEESYK